MSLTVETTVQEYWKTQAALCIVCPAANVFIATPNLPQVLPNFTYPIVVLREKSVESQQRTSDGNRVLTSKMSLTSFHLKRDEAHKISNAIGDAYNKLSTTYDRGTILDMRPMTRSEKQDEASQVWSVENIFRLIYTVTA